MKNYNILYQLCIFSLVVLFASCGKSEDEVFDNPFIIVEAANSASAGPVDSDQEILGEYAIYVSSKALTQNIEVNYEIVVGNGLVAGRDFEIITKDNPLVFHPGICDMPIRIKWLRTCVRDEDTGVIIEDPLDDTKDITITIKLTKNSMDFTLGYPGPKQDKKEIVIAKKKATS